MTPDFDHAIAAAEANRLTHVHWRDWRRKGHGTDEDHELVGDIAHHEEAIAEYDMILACLHAGQVAEDRVADDTELREALAAVTPGDISDLGGLASQYAAVYKMHAVFHAARALTDPDR